MDGAGKISVVIPVFDSQDSLAPLTERLIKVITQMGRGFEIIFVDDCSQDNSWQVLKQLKQQHGQLIKLVRLLVNGGQHNAILCGFSMIEGDVAITMDDDLQNPPEEIPRMVEALEEGYDLVIGAYETKKHSGLRNMSGSIIDKLQRRVFNLPSDFQLTSFRAFTKPVIAQVKDMRTAFPYITSMLLANSSRRRNVVVRHDARAFGKSNYTFKRSFVLSLNLILHYTSYPLRFIAVICTLAFLTSLGVGAWAAVKVLVFGTAVAGWASTIVAITFSNAFILLCLLIFGFYISRFHQEITRTRTSYKISEIHD